MKIERIEVRSVALPTEQFTWPDDESERYLDLRDMSAV